MNPPLPNLSGKKVAKCLERLGYEYVSTKGSHLKLKSSSGRVVIVPLHKELAKGTLRSVLRQADLTVDELFETI